MTCSWSSPPGCLCAACDPALDAEYRGAVLVAADRAELDGWHVGPAADEFLAAVLPGRLALRAAAAGVLARLVGSGCRVCVEDGAARVSPLSRVPAELAAWLSVPANRAAVEDLLDEGA